MKLTLKSAHPQSRGGGQPQMQWASPPHDQDPLSHVPAKERASSVHPSADEISCSQYILDRADSGILSWGAGLLPDAAAHPILTN